MGILETSKELKPFTDEDLHNRSLIIQMLRYEDQLFFSEAQELYKNPSFNNFTSIEVQKTIQRKTLANFGFDTSDQSLDTYRTIVQVYWRGPDDYDKKVLDSVVYLRANKLLYYTYPTPTIGDQAIDINLYQLDKKEKQSTVEQIPTKLSDHWNHHRTLICAFSTS